MSHDVALGPGPCSSLPELLRERATYQPARVAYTFLLDGESRAAELTYQELDRKARAVAALLTAQTPPGSRALLVYPAGLEFITAFLGCLYANVVAVPTFPPDSGRAQRALPRLRAITNDAQPGLALTETALLPALDEFL